MARIDYERQRGRELVAAVYAHMGGGRSLKEAIRDAAGSPCSRFWVSPETASKRIRAYLAGREYCPTRPNKREMVMEIMRRCRGDYSIGNITRVVEQPAPRFYLTAATARTVFFQSISRRRRDRLNGGRQIKRT